MDDSTDRPGAAGGGTAGSRLRDRLLLTADRGVVAGALLLVVFASLVVAGALDPLGLRAAVERGDPISTLFQALVTSIITGVTLVVTINQLVISQELGPVGDQRQRMEGAMTFRQDVEEVLDRSVSPARPSSFLAALVGQTRRRARRLPDAAAGTGAEDRVDDYVGDIVASTRSVEGRLDEATFGTFEVVLAALHFDYSRQLHEARRLRNELAADFSAAEETAFEDLIEVLALFGPAREHVKTLYFQWELVDLSRRILYTSVPALVVAVGVVLYVNDPATVVGTTLGVDNLVWSVSAATTLAVAPFAVLLSYVLRIATVAKRTLAIGPFVLQGGTDD